MFNAEEIIELESKWFKYKLKQKSKLVVFLLISIGILFFIAYNIFLSQQVKYPIKQISTQSVSIPTIKKMPNDINSTIIKKAIVINDINKTTTIPKPKVSKENIIVVSKVPVENINSKPYYFKLFPTAQGSGLFSSNGFLTLNVPFTTKEQITVNKNANTNIATIREIQTKSPNKFIENKKQNISIDMHEVDTITYLKDKYYATSSIVFALMLAEEYYYTKEYKNALKWSLTANDIDSQNTKSWYWFAKSKVKLNQKEDARRALEAYLSNNSSKRLSTLLHKIELGDTDD